MRLGPQILSLNDISQRICTKPGRQSYDIDGGDDGNCDSGQHESRNIKGFVPKWAKNQLQ